VGLTTRTSDKPLPSLVRDALDWRRELRLNDDALAARLRTLLFWPGADVLSRGFSDP